MNKIKIFIFSSGYFLFSGGYIFAAGLVPCGGVDEPVCTWCHLFQVFKNVIDYALMIIFPLAAIMIVYGGITMMIARDNATKFSQGKDIMTAAVVGILIALLSWLILDTVFKIIAPGFEGNFGPWNELICSA